MSLLSLHGITLAFGAEKLLDNAYLAIQPGDRIGLLGRNGAGKSTLLALIAQKIPPDAGELRITPGVRVAMLEQTPEFSGNTTIFDVVSDGLGEIGQILSRYHQILSSDNLPEHTLLKHMESLQQQIDAGDGWNLQQRVEKVLSRLSLPANIPVASLSGGWQRRVSLARALVSDPSILLLDEPTNHLDLTAIQWLENELATFHGAILFVTHDRVFLQKIANCIVDLDRGVLRVWAGGYRDYLRRKADFLEQEARQNAEFDRKLAQEERWIRQGIQGRRTRNEGRVRTLQKMRIERQKRQEHQGKVRLELEHTDHGSKLLIEARDISFAYGKTVIAQAFSTRIMKGDRVGLIGANGIGKTTLIQLLLGKQVPDSGQVRVGRHLKVAWFDQLRSQLDLESTVMDAIGEGREKIMIGSKEIHVISYLSNFLFTPARSRSPVKSLSGGERARVMLAKLFSKPTNLLILDEPTNDLDIETLELLEEKLLDYQGTLILVSHDRQFMDNVVTSTLSLYGEGVIREYVGGYSDWERQQPALSQQPIIKNQSLQLVSTRPHVSAKKAVKKKLRNREQQELEQLPNHIEKLEKRQRELSSTISDSAFYRQDQETVTASLRELDRISQELEECYRRWEELES